MAGKIILATLNQCRKFEKVMQDFEQPFFMEEIGDYSTMVPDIRFVQSENKYAIDIDMLKDIDRQPGMKAAMDAEFGLDVRDWLQNNWYPVTDYMKE